jgi:hypothetical protein
MDAERLMLIDTDTAADDAVAIAMALGRPGVKGDGFGDQWYPPVGEPAQQSAVEATLSLLRTHPVKSLGSPSARSPTWRSRSSPTPRPAGACTSW